jgi:hypothetical protein
MRRSIITARLRHSYLMGTQVCAPASLQRERAMKKRRRFKQTEPLASRLDVFAQLMRERAELMPPGREKADTLAKADQAEAAAELERSLSASRPPAQCGASDLQTGRILERSMKG